MPLWASAAVTLLLGSVAIQNIYAAFKPVKKDGKRELQEVFSYGDGPFAVLGLFFAFSFWFSGKFFPAKYQLIAFRFIAFLLASALIGVIVLVWNFDAVADFMMSE